MLPLYAEHSADFYLCFCWCSESALNDFISVPECMIAAFQISLKGGIRLGKEAFSRIRFAGFDYEVNGSFTRVAAPQHLVFTVYEQEFESFREALAFASNAYQIKKSRLSKLYFEHGESFEKAIEVFHKLVDHPR